MSPAPLAREDLLAWGNQVGHRFTLVAFRDCPVQTRGAHSPAAVASPYRKRPGLVSWAQGAVRIGRVPNCDNREDTKVDQAAKGTAEPAQCHMVFLADIDPQGDVDDLNARLLSQP